MIPWSADNPTIHMTAPEDPAWKIQPGDPPIVTAAAPILMEGIDATPLLKGGQGRTGADVRAYGMAIFVPVVIGVIILALKWIL